MDCRTCGDRKASRSHAGIHESAAPSWTRAGSFRGAAGEGHRRPLPALRVNSRWNPSFGRSQSWQGPHSQEFVGVNTQCDVDPSVWRVALVAAEIS